MRSPAFLLFLVLAGAAGCDDDAADPESDAGPGRPSDASIPDARVTTAIDAGGDARIDASRDAAPDAAPEAGADPCPPSLELRGPFIVDQQVERALPPALGGAITSGTYHLTKSELVINPLASEPEKASCREEEPYSARQALQFEAESSLRGTVLARSLDTDSWQGAQELVDYVSPNTYNIDGINLVIRPSGLACEDTTISYPDGGVEKEHEVITPDTEDDPTTFTATADTVTLYELWAADGDVPSCTYVSTFSK